MKVWAIAVVAAAVILVGAVLAAEQGNAEKPLSPQEIAALTKASPVVAALPYRYETEYIQDPFEPDRIRRTRTEITHIVIVRADGSLEVKPAR